MDTAREKDVAPNCPPGVRMPTKAPMRAKITPKAAYPSPGSQEMAMITSTMVTPSTQPVRVHPTK